MRFPPRKRLGISAQLQSTTLKVTKLTVRSQAIISLLTASYEGLDASSYDALVIPGGRAPEYLALEETVIALVKEFMQSRKPVASICHGQQILAAAGVLKVVSCCLVRKPVHRLTNTMLSHVPWLVIFNANQVCREENVLHTLR